MKMKKALLSLSLQFTALCMVFYPHYIELHMSRSHRLMDVKRNSSSKIVGRGCLQKTLTYKNGGRGQGVGNIMNGLIVAALLSEQANRKLCVYWPAFETVFKTRNSCPCPRTSNTTYTHFWNFGNTHSKDHVFDVLFSDVEHVEMTGNDYPGYKWPSVPVTLFQNLFSSKISVPVVQLLVHIRVGDNLADQRIRHENILKVRQLYPNATLITNDDRLYDTTGWARPNYRRSTKFHTTASIFDRTLWHDWYSIYLAKFVIHTASSFSESALRLSCAPSKRISDGSSLLIDETWTDLRNK